jgi:acetyl-CoA decarbonylase/synthase complex subunit epsilon
VVGHQAVEIQVGEEKLIDYAIRLSGAARIPLIATAHIAGDIRKRGFREVVSMPLVDIVNRLIDESWTGLDGNGPYDLAIFMGIHYYMEWVILSGLKHFAPTITTLSLDPFYQPHARWSFPNMLLKDWKQSLNEIIDRIQASSVPSMHAQQ